jgi:hypothetical protein
VYGRATIQVEVGSDDRLFDIHTMHSQSSFANQKVAKSLEYMFVVFVGSNIVISNLKIHERKTAEHGVYWGVLRELPFKCQAYECFPSSRLNAYCPKARLAAAFHCCIDQLSVLNAFLILAGPREKDRSSAVHS